MTEQKKGPFGFHFRSLLVIFLPLVLAFIEIPPAMKSLLYDTLQGWTRTLYHPSEGIYFAPVPLERKSSLSLEKVRSLIRDAASQNPDVIGVVLPFRIFYEETRQAQEQSFADWKKELDQLREKGIKVVGGYDFQSFQSEEVAKDLFGEEYIGFLNPVNVGDDTVRHLPLRREGKDGFLLTLLRHREPASLEGENPFDRQAPLKMLTEKYQIPLDSSNKFQLRYFGTSEFELQEKGILFQPKRWDKKTNLQGKILLVGVEDIRTGWGSHKTPLSSTTPLSEGLILYIGLDNLLGGNVMRTPAQWAWQELQFLTGKKPLPAIWEKAANFFFLLSFLILVLFSLSYLSPILWYFCFLLLSVGAVFLTVYLFVLNIQMPFLETLIVFFTPMIKLPRLLFSGKEN